MEFPMLEDLVRSNGENILFAAFFATLAVLGVLETQSAMRADGGKRRYRWPANFALTAANIAIMGILPLSQLAMADLARDQGFGLLNMGDGGPFLGLVVTFLAFSLQSWAVHLAMHKIPVLWRVHRVHHTDTHLDISTTVRFHPVEFIIQLPVSAAVILALGAPPSAVILYGIFDAVVNAFSHANLRLPARLDRALGLVIVTPHLHRVHHSPIRPETDSNFGATLPLWDRLFGTFRAKSPEALAVQGIGLNEMQDDRAWSLWWMLSLPFRPILRDAAEASRKATDAPADLRVDP
jgi:sterol desaturase/sphingolipid hydroxylase (fatty acid hydroxylase superfamily)